MIEYRLLCNAGIEEQQTSWRRAHFHFKPRPNDFERLYFRINGSVYLKWDDDFTAAVMWHNLKKEQYD